MITQKEYDKLFDQINNLKTKKELLYIENQKKISDYIVQLRKDSGYDELINQIKEKQNYAINIISDIIAD